MVHEVLLVNESEIEPVPEVGDDMQKNFILGLAKGKDKVTILLDIEKVVQSGDLDGVEVLEKAIAGAV